MSENLRLQRDDSLRLEPDNAGPHLPGPPLLKLLLAALVCANTLPAFTGPGAAKIDTFAGGGLGDGDAQSVALFNIRGMAFDSSGDNLYFADTNHRRVRKWNIPSNTVTTVAGNGTNAYTGDGGPALDATLKAPYSVGVDNAGNVYICDITSRVIRKVNTSGIISTYAGTGTFGVTGDGGPASAALFRNPISIFVDGPGNVYVSDSGANTVRKIDTGGTITRVAGRDPNVVEIPPAYQDGIQATTASMDTPEAIWVNSAGEIFICDYNNSVVRKVATNGIISKVAGTYANPASSTPSDNAVATSGVLAGPMYMGGDNLGNLYVGEATTHIIRKIVIGGALSTYAGVLNTPGFSGDGGAPTAAKVNFPRGFLYSGASSTLYIADSGNNYIRKVTGGIITSVVGNGTQDTVSAGNRSNTPLNNANAILRRKDTGDIYIVNRGSHTVLRVGATDNIATVVAGIGTAGHTGDGGQATAAQLALPQTAAADGAGNLYVLESGPTGNEPYIRKIAPNGIISTIAGNGTVGYTASGPALGAQLGGLGTAGAACDSAGNLYFAEPLNDCIRKISTGGTLSTYAGTCQSGGFSGDGAAATAAKLDNPAHLYFDAADNLFIVDANNNRVRKVTAGGTISTVAGSSLTGGYSGDGGAATAAQLNQPGGVFVDPTGAIFISDRSNRVIRRVDPFTNFISTIAGNGTNGFSGDGGLALSAAIGSGATGLTGDEDGNLFIADSTNNRVRWVGGVVAIPTPTFTVTPTSTATATQTPTRTITKTVSPSSTATASGTVTPSPTESDTPTITLTATPTPTGSSTPSVTPTGTPTDTSTVSPSATDTATSTDTPTHSPSATETSTSTDSPTATESSTATPTATATDTPTHTPSATETPTLTVTPTDTDTPTDSPTATQTDTSTASPTATSSPTPTDTATVTPSVTPSATPTITQTFTHSPTPTDSPTPAWSQSGLGKAVLAPVPLKAGQPLCLYFDGNPSRSTWKVYGSDGARVADLSFAADLRQCWDGTASLAPGVYYLNLDIDYADGRHEARTQKVMVLK